MASSRNSQSREIVSQLADSFFGPRLCTPRTMNPFCLGAEIEIPKLTDGTADTSSGYAQTAEGAVLRELSAGPLSRYAESKHPS